MYVHACVVPDYTCGAGETGEAMVRSVGARSATKVLLIMSQI